MEIILKIVQGQFEITIGGQAVKMGRMSRLAREDATCAGEGTPNQLENGL